MRERERAREKLKELFLEYSGSKYLPLLIKLTLSSPPRFRFIPLDSRLERAQRVRVAEELKIPLREVRPYTFRKGSRNMKVIPIPIKHVHLAGYILFSYSYPMGWRNGNLLIPLRNVITEVDPLSWKIVSELGSVWKFQLRNPVFVTRPGDPLTGRSESSGPKKAFFNLYFPPVGNEVSFLTYGILEEIEALLDYMFIDINNSILAKRVEVVGGFEPLFVEIEGKKVLLRHVPTDAMGEEPVFDPGIVIRAPSWPYDRPGVPCYDAFTEFKLSSKRSSMASPKALLLE